MGQNGMGWDEMRNNVLGKGGQEMIWDGKVYEIMGNGIEWNYIAEWSRDLGQNGIESRNDQMKRDGMSG